MDADALAAFLRERPEHRVGHYFENLVHYWLRHIRRVEIVAHRQPVRDGERTLGELDFIFRDEAGRLIHWEVAVKFYLRAEASDGGPARYLGPNTTDRLERKIARLRDHQLPLSERVYPGVALREGFVKGRIHHHRDIRPSAGEAPDLHPDHLRGDWLRRGELRAWLDAECPEIDQFVVMRKPLWFTPRGEAISRAVLESTVEDHFNQGRTALHVAALYSGGGEHRRFFVVDDAWPW